MNLTQVPIVGAPAWRPAAWVPAFMSQATPPAPAPAKASLWNIDGPVFAVATDVVLTTSLIILALPFGHYKSRWSSVFWGLSAIAGFKTFLDISRIYR